MNLRQILSWLLLGSQGGETRYRILFALNVHNSLNAHQIAKLLELDYTTIRYHLDKLVENRIVAHGDQSYQRTYFLTEASRAEWDYFLEITQSFREPTKKEVDT